MTEIGRLLTAMVTPFDDKGRVDFEQAKRLALALVASGSDGVVVVGTTGESPSLTPEEQKRLFAEVKSALKGKGAVIAGTGSNSTAEAVHYTQDAQEAGADGCLLVVPYYNNPTQEGLYQHFKAIAESTDLPCILYNVPSRTVRNMEAETTVRLSGVKNIVGVKEASGNMGQVGAILRDAGKGFKVWSGNDADTFLIMCMGGYGVVSVASHLVGKQIKSMMNMVLDGSVEGAAREHLRMLPLSQGLFVVANPIPVKYCVNRAGFNVGKPRLPLVEPDEKTAKFLDDLMSHYTVDLPVEMSNSGGTKTAPKRAAGSRAGAKR
ncbi:MAG: 4-hydroxy-tetrahydrodipicolinate synthase [Chloroflexi bacterium]|nr:4-hydroxy-tetrahydrodipicolinate synthase [Chloroflexota bacterium]